MAGYSRAGDVAEIVIDNGPLNLFGPDLLGDLEAAVARAAAERPRVEKVVGITPLMGGTQRIAERAGTARAREFVMTGDLYDAQELHAWGVVNRLRDGAELLEQARAHAAGLAAGPTIAHAATKAVVRAQADHGTRGADARTAELTSHLFETEDARNAVRSFLSEGPAKARYSGK